MNPFMKEMCQDNCWKEVSKVRWWRWRSFLAKNEVNQQRQTNEKEKKYCTSRIITPRMRSGMTYILKVLKKSN